MSVKNIVDAALERARSYAGGSEKVASAGARDLTKEAHQAADALEYLALDIVDDGTAAGTASRQVVADFFKRAEKGASPGESVSPTGTQATPPQAGAKKILPTGLAKGNAPAESEAPTGTQATIGQPPHEKKGSGPMTLLDLLTKQAESPTQSTALQDTADPGRQNENANVGLLASEQSIVNATKRDAKLPTRARLKALFSSASDTGPSSAAAKAAFPNAYAKGGMKVAEADEKRCEKCGKEPCECKAEAEKEAAEADEDEKMLSGGAHSRRIGVGSAIGAGLGALGGAAASSPGKRVMNAIGGGVAGGVHGAMAGHFYNQGIHSGHRDEKRRPGERGVVTPENAIGTLFHAPSGVANMIGRGKGIDIAERGRDKEASLSDYAALFDKAASGELGEEAKAFADYIEQVRL